MPETFTQRRVRPSGETTEGRRAGVRGLVLRGLSAQFGEDNVGVDEDDEWTVGVFFADGGFVTMHIGEAHDRG